MTAKLVLLETLEDGTTNYKLDMGTLGVFFLSFFKGQPMIETWEAHIKAYPEHKEV